MRKPSDTPPTAAPPATAAADGFDPRHIDAKNVSSSTAGASSGNFHVYLNQRRREHDRLAALHQAAETSRKEDTRLAAIQARISKEDTRTARRSAKRRRAKERQSAHKAHRPKSNLFQNSNSSSTALTSIPMHHGDKDETLPSTMKDDDARPNDDDDDGRRNVRSNTGVNDDSIPTSTGKCHDDDAGVEGQSARPSHQTTDMSSRTESIPTSSPSNRENRGDVTSQTK